MSQINLLHTYDSASTCNTSVNGQLMIVNFEISGQRYVKINRQGKCISIYNLNHSLLKNISLSSFPVNAPYGTVGDVLYLSENLFNTDSKIEFMYSLVNYGGSSVYTGIYNEDGVLIFSDSAIAAVKVNYPLQQFPIYNTPEGTIMILSYKNGQAKVFSLPGTLSEGIVEANGQLMQQSGTFSNLYPNPGNGAVTLVYELPIGESEGELVLYDLQGTEVKRYTVDNTFKDVIIDNTQLPAGTYFYQLQTSKGAVGTKKMVVVK
jgi:hypothetical protein